ncbi:MAG: leucine-rich repeat protein [Prevotella sp.]|nr:leucine-rich repeat protein [Prevotella sp.]
MSKLDEPVGSYLTVSQSDVTIPTGDTYQIKVKTINSENPITYESSDPTVATVDANGLVTSVADGEAVITVSVAGDAYYKEGTTQVKVAVKRPLTFEALEDGGGIDVYSCAENPVYYTMNGGAKKEVSYGWNTIEVSKGDKVEFESANECLGGNVRICPYGAKCAVYGNVMSMISPDGNYHTNKTITQPNALASLLNGYSRWDNEKQERIYYTVSHDKYKLVLPATKLTESCYSRILANTGITEVPELPATELPNYCYQYMFFYCENLTTAPEIVATKVGNYSCAYMFEYCTNLTTAQKLAATEVGDYGYFRMFQGCTKLTTAPEIAATKVGNYSCAYMFYGCENLTTAQKLAVTEVGDNGYYYMFQNCKNLTTAPEITATKVGNYSCAYMFYGCESMTKAPQKLPATDLSGTDDCYYRMFENCKKLTTAPEIAATKMGNYSCAYMFTNCESLTKAPQRLAATDLSEANRCYNNMFYNCKKLTTAPEIAATKMGNYSCAYMFYGCENLTKAPQLPATELDSYCYRGMFQDCKSLTAAPELPAKYLPYGCYRYMFENCTKLSTVKCLAVTMDGYSLDSWLIGAGTDPSVTTRTFIHAAENTNWVNNDYGSGYDWCVPTGWTIQAAK